LLTLIATDQVASEGQNIPSLSRVIVGGGFKAAILSKQRIGRGMRPDGIVLSGETWGGKVEILDFIDNQHPKLLTHSDRRVKHYKSVGAVVQERQYVRGQSTSTAVI
jgi:superfamily II DNA or RNA helicase